MLQSQKKMRQEKTVLSDSQVAELRLVYKTMTIEQLCCKFHVGTVRLYEILREYGMDDRMPMKRRKTEVINDAQVRKEPKPKCAYCKPTMESAFNGRTPMERKTLKMWWPWSETRRKSSGNLSGMISAT